jgi:hypothetical protein
MYFQWELPKYWEDMNLTNDGAVFLAVQFNLEKKKVNRVWALQII